MKKMILMLSTRLPSNLTPLLSKKDSDFIDALTKLSSHKNDMLFKAFQYITLAEIKDT